MRVICCMCGIALRDIESAEHLQDAVSHGLCEPCFHSMKAQFGMKLNDYIEGIPAPVVVVDDTGEILSLNAQASARFERAPRTAAKAPNLVIFDCVYARQARDCEYLLCCSGCTIRQAVGVTRDSGASTDPLPAVFTAPNEETTAQDADVLISTTQDAGVIYLTLEFVHTQK